MLGESERTKIKETQKVSTEVSIYSTLMLWKHASYKFIIIVNEEGPSNKTIKLLKTNKHRITTNYDCSEHGNTGNVYYNVMTLTKGDTHKENL